VVSFPVPGSYLYEIDYQSGTGGPLSFSIAGLRPLVSLTLTSTSGGSPVTGQPVTFSVQATDESGAPIANLPVTFGVTGANQQALPATTDNTGKATVTYAGQAAGTDVMQATATLNGLSLVSNQSAVTWISANAPQITITGDLSLQLPNPGHYTATIVNHGTGLAIAWSKVSGPGNVTFDTPSQATVGALFDTPGAYVLKVTATDTLGGGFGNSASDRSRPH